MINEKEIKPVKLMFLPNAPVKIKIVEDNGENVFQLSETQKAIAYQVVETIKAYLKATEDLLKGKYAGIKGIAPLHLSNSGNVLIVCCEEGVLVRYEKKQDQASIISAWSSERLSTLAPKISEFVVYCHDNENFISSVSATGPLVDLSAVNESTGQTRCIHKMRIGFDAILPKFIMKMPPPPNKPYCLLSVRNSFEVHVIAYIPQVGNEHFWIFIASSRKRYNLS